MAISLEEATLVSLFVQCILYGIFSIMLIVSTYVLLQRRAVNSNVSKWILAGAPLMFLLATIHVSTDLARVIIAFIQNPSQTFNILNSSASTIYLLKTSVFIIQTWLGDGFMIYRMYLAWNGAKRVVIPIYFAYLGSIIVSIGTLRACATKATEASIFSLRNWVYGCFAMTLAVNLTCTVLIAVRILYFVKLTRNITVHGRNPASAAVIVIESGALYSICLVFLLALFGLENFAQYIALDAIVPMVGIVFTMITVRVGLGMSFQHETTQRNTTRRSRRAPLVFNHINNTTAFSQELTKPTPALAINVSRVTHTDVEDREYPLKSGGLIQSPSADDQELEESRYLP